VSASTSLTVYDGRTLIGTVVGDGEGHEAFDAQGLSLGKFNSRPAAMAAIDEACKKPASDVAGSRGRGRPQRSAGGW
jgi:hypothetical protein